MVHLAQACGSGATHDGSWDVNGYSRQHLIHDVVLSK